MTKKVKDLPVGSKKTSTVKGGRNQEDLDKQK